MANSFTTQILVDGARNVVVKGVGILDTSDLAATAIIDPASFTPTPTQLRIDKIFFSIEDGLDVRLQWDATAAVYIIDLVKTGMQDFKHFGGLQNNAGAGKTGKILISTEGWTAGVHEFSVILHCVKEGV